MDVYKKAQFKGPNGFTLIELLVTLSIASILLAIGLPSFVTFINNNRVSAQANDLVFSFHMARSEATKRGTEVRVVSIGGTNWNGGWRVVADTNNDGDFLDANDVLMTWDSVVSGALTLVATNAPSNAYISFNSRGSVSPNNASYSFTLKPDDCDAIDSRIIAVESSGRASVAKKDCS